MALGLIKKVFSFGRHEVQDRPADTETLAPLNFDALKDLADPPTPVPQPTPAEPPSPPETPPAQPPEEPAPAKPQPEIVPEPGPPETEPAPPEVPQPQPAQPAELPVPTPVEVPVPSEPTEPQPSVPEHVPDAPAPQPAPTPVEIPAPGPNVPSEPRAGKVTVAKKVEQKAAPAKAHEPAPRASWFQRLRDGLSRSSKELSSSIAGVFTKRKLDEDTLQDLEDVLIRADLGMETAICVTDALSSGRYGRDVSDAEVRAIMAEEVEKVLTPVALPLELDLSHKPHVVLVVGVNGTGKTTTIGKLAAKLADGGLKVMLAAGDTFRAAAIEQLRIWGERTGAPVVASKLGADAAGLAYEAFEKAKAEGSDVLIIDTAGRLQNKTELMAELEKIVRVLGKLDPEAPHTVLQTVDATTGQNALNQVEIFRNVAGVNGLVMTKLDGTARGGILVAIAAKYKLPVYFIGVGEQVDDLEPFSASDFAKAIAGVA
jgi:fused signal recognition particle receptor